MIGLLSSVQRDTLSSRVVADAAAGATTLLLADAKPFDVNGGTVKFGDGTLLAYATVDQDAGTMTLAAPLAGAVSTDTPVVQMTGEGEAESWTAWVTVDPTSSETLPASIPLALVQFFREGTVQAGTPVEYGVGLSGTYEVTTRPDQPGVQDVRNAIVDEDGTTVPAAIAAAASSGGDGTPTTAPDSSPTPDPYQDSGAVAVRWDVPADPRTHVRMYLALAVTNSDGSGSVDTSVTPGVSNLYAGDVQPIAKVSTLTLGGAALDPAKHYQVALGAWNAIGEAPVSAWVLCQPAFIAGVLVADEVIARAITGSGISIASTPAADYPQPFSGTSLPSGWQQARSLGAPSETPTATSAVADVISAGTPSGTDGSVLRFTASRTTGGTASTAQVTTSYTVGDFSLDARLQYTGPTASSVTGKLYLGARAQNRDDGWANAPDGVVVTIPVRGAWRVDVNDRTSIFGDGYPDGGGSIVPGVWYRVHLSANGGILKASLWPESQAKPADKVGETAVSFFAGWGVAKMDNFMTASAASDSTWYIDYFNVTGYSTGFQVLPDATGDWPQVLDPIRTKNTQQDTRLTTNESNIAANTTATQTNASAITALGTRVTSLEQRPATLAKSTAAVSPTSTTALAVTGASVSFTVGSTSEQWMLEVAADVSITVAGTTNIVAGLLDGAGVDALAINTRGAASTRTTSTKRIPVTGLSVGSHTLTAQTSNTAASTGATVNAGSTVMVQRTA